MFLYIRGGVVQVIEGDDQLRKDGVSLDLLVRKHGEWGEKITGLPDWLRDSQTYWLAVVHIAL